jgi:hypothetical protein
MKNRSKSETPSLMLQAAAIRPVNRTKNSLEYSLTFPLELAPKER